jgi:hypothetical protein
VQAPYAEAHKLLDVGLQLAALDGLAAAGSLPVRTGSSLLLDNLPPQLPEERGARSWQESTDIE